MKIARAPRPPPPRDPRTRDAMWVLLPALLLGLGGGPLTACAVTAEGSAPESVDADVTGGEVAAELRSRGGEPDPVVRYLSLPPVPLARQEPILDALRDAVREARERRSVTAALRADSLLALLPALQDWRPLVRAELLAVAGDTAGVRRALEQLDPETELASRWGWLARMEAFEATRDLVAARRTAEDAALAAPTVARAAEPWLRAGRMALEAGDSAAARDAFLASLRAGAEHGSARAAAQALDRIHEGTRAEQLEVGRALLVAGAWDRAHRRLLPLIDDPGLPEVIQAELRLGLGRALVEMRRPAEAVAMLAPLTGEATPPDLAAPALFWTGRAALARDRTGDAETAFRRLARRAPESPLAEEGLLLLLETTMDGGAAPRAAPWFDELFVAGVRSPAGELAAVRFGAAKYLAGEYEAAANAFERYLEGSRRTATRQQAAYWAALAHERRGDEARSRERLRAVWEDEPLSFYGVFAGERIGAPILPAGLDTGPRPVPGLDVELANALLRLRVHRIVPTPGSFTYEMGRLQEHFFRRGDGAYDFAEAMIGGGLPQQGILLGREIHRREGAWNQRLLRIVYPLPYGETLVREARARGLDPFFVAGLIRQESMFDAAIRSSAGAVGLMQLMPATAQEVARSLGIRVSAASLEDPEVNLRLGTQYLASMIRRFDGRAEDALSAYNAGPSRINQWRRRPEYRDRDVFIEQIPFRETRNYVKVVQQNTRIYAALYGCAGFQPCLGESYATVLARSPYAGGAPGSALAR